ncbi:MAG: hypothetical protein K2H18_02150 [Muribaculaceae bacterium]|nr:hypothetical protein [Muribaculaceae bacterium]
MSYKALRHTYGFGVHSPFAFNLVKDVVRPGRGYGWYGYEDIDAAVNSRRGGLNEDIGAAVNSRRDSLKTERQAKMFLRLLSFLNPRSLFLPLGIDPLFYIAAKASDKRMRIERKPKMACECEMIATHASFISLDRLKEHIAKPGNSIVIMDLPDGWADALFELLPEGLMLHSKRNAIIIHRPDMMKLSYNILL